MKILYTHAINDFRNKLNKLVDNKIADIYFGTPSLKHMTVINEALDNEDTKQWDLVFNVSPSLDDDSKYEHLLYEKEHICYYKISNQIFLFIPTSTKAMPDYKIETADAFLLDVIKSSEQMAMLCQIITGVSIADVFEKIKEENTRELLNAVTAIATNNFQNMIDSREQDLEEKRLRVETYRRQMTDAVKQYENLLQFRVIPDMEAYKKALVDDLLAISNHKKVVDMKVIDTNKLMITTTPLIMRHPTQDRRFFLGDVNITLPLNQTTNVRIINLNNRRRGLWGSNDNHPHVGNEGTACFGNVEGTIAEYLGKNMYYPTFIMLLNYLETFNPSDSAGAYYRSWDEIDKDGNIIEKGDEDTAHDDTSYPTCDVCGEEAEDVWECDICGIDCCEDHQIFCQQSDRTYCPQCQRDYDIVRCTHCHEYYERENNESCPNCGCNTVE